MAKVTVYNEQGKKLKDLQLNAKIFGVKINPTAVHQAIVSAMANQRQNLAHAKDRSEVRGGGRKPWRQKGTGRARHGSSRSPIWIGGGVTFGPTKDRNFSQKINRKMKRQVLFMCLSDRARENDLLAIDKFDTFEYKTKKIAEILKNLKLDNSVLIVNEKNNEQFIKSVKNLPKVEVIEARNLNALAVLKHKKLLIALDAITALEKVFLSKAIKEKSTDQADLLPKKSKAKAAVKKATK